MNTVYNARVSLTATIINNLVAAFAVAGFVAPAASGLLDSAGRWAVAVAWSGIAVGLHLLACAILGGLKPDLGANILVADLAHDRRGIRRVWRPMAVSPQIMNVGTTYLPVITFR
jgi:hypothetical protein